MKVVGIIGEKNYIKFFLDNETYVKGYGELLPKAFCVHQDTLHLVFKDKSEIILSPEQQSEIMTAVNDYLFCKIFKVNFL